MEAEKYALQIVKRLVKEGYVAYYAGGWVRDYVMEHPSSDVDIATDAPPQVILDLFPQTILVGLAFGVVIVLIEGHQFEVSSFRKDLRYEGGRRPAEIEFSNAREDASRRDFTINGMFYDPLEERIHDYVGGIEDIHKGVIRTIGDPDARFREDRLRMIRAVRFAARFGFSIDLGTQDAIVENAPTLFPPVAMERVWQEFCKMANYPRFDHALVELHRLGLLQVIFPDLVHVHLNDIKQRVGSFAYFPERCPTILYLMELFPEADGDARREVAVYLHTSNHDALLADYCYRLRQAAQGGVAKADRHEWSHLLTHPQAETCLRVIAASMGAHEREHFLAEFFAFRKQLLPHIERIMAKRPLVSAAVLLGEGIAPGKEMGALIKEAEKLAIRYDLHETDKVMQKLKETPLWQNRK